MVPIVVPYLVAASKKIVEAMRREPRNVRFADLLRICTEYFGQPRQSGTSHAIFKTSWLGDPRVNIQNDKGKAKAYQVRQVLAAIDKLRELEDETRSKQKSED